MKSIELSDKVYNRLKALKSTEESWDKFLLRIADTLQTLHPSNQEWSDAYKKAFRENIKTFEKLAT